MRSIDKLLVANRGEIALRVMRTARAMGIATVAVYSDADADAPFVRFADEAVRIGPPPARESYLSIPAVLDAARVTGAHAIHPGYGFLSENPLFADAVADAGLVFVGPPGEVIRKLGSKQAAKRIAERVGVPIVPGYHGDDQAHLADHARAIGFPVLIKASAGGGGKGMRIVRGQGELAEAIERARGEALAAFGDDTLLVERYVERPRHIEIQILGDTHGNIVHLWERECSIQRRHQKILEESPSVALDPARRAAMGEAAVALGRAVGYIGAGTVEFIVSGAEFFFLEVNTRLQVEHPVTELTCGVDLVREQIRIARGEALGFTQLVQRGAAIEVRLCAEDPDREYLPTTGTLHAVEVPIHSLRGLRGDLGVAAGSEIGIHYDSMLGKIIAHADTRAEAAQLLRRALEETWVPGVVTNREHLVRILAHPAFIAGELDTHFLERHAGELAAREPGLDRLRVAAVAATLHAIATRRDPAAPAPPGWRNVRFADQLVTYTHGSSEIQLGYRPAGESAFDIAIGGKTTHVTGFGLDGDHLWFVEHGNHRRGARVIAAAGRIYVLADGHLTTLVEAERFPAQDTHAVAGGLVAPMPGKVVKVLVTAGQEVVAGAALVILEAMKMEHTVRAAAAGTVREVHVVVGDQVDADRLIAVVA